MVKPVSLFRQQYTLLTSVPGAFEAMVEMCGLKRRVLRSCWYGDYSVNSHGVLIAQDEVSTHLFLGGRWVDWDSMDTHSFGYDPANVTPVARPVSQ